MEIWWKLWWIIKSGYPEDEDSDGNNDIADFLENSVDEGIEDISCGHLNDFTNKNMFSASKKELNDAEREDNSNYEYNDDLDLKKYKTFIR